jgi:hypothetical protein
MAKPTLAIPLWKDPRVELPDADITVKILADDGITQSIVSFESAFYDGDGGWTGELIVYNTEDVFAWRDLTEEEADEADEGEEG